MCQCPCKIAEKYVIFKIGNYDYDDDDISISNKMLLSAVKIWTYIQI